MSIFTCCERLDETKYLHTCGCPSASFTCESEEVNATLCGWDEFDGYESTPPNRYMTRGNTGSGQFIRRITATGEEFARSNIVIAGSKTYSNECVVSGGYTQTRSYTDIDDGELCSTTSAYSSEGLEDIARVHVATNDRCAILFNGAPTSSTVSASSYSKEYTGTDTNTTGSWTVTLTDIDTESNALARETPITGTSCSSLWETRSTGFSFKKRTSGYTIECADLIIGYEYEATPSIRKRTSVIGSYGAWEDVTVTPITFTATAKTETIDDEGNPIDLDHIQGYEYEITSVTIEKTA